MKTLILLLLFLFQWTVGSRPHTVGTTPAPVAAWPMNEGSGLVFNDVSGNGNTATLNAAVTWQSNAGFPGTTPLFNGTQTATTTSTSLLNFPATQPFTVAFCTTNVSSSNGSTFISTLTNSAPFTGWEAATIGAAGGSLFEFYLINNYPSNAINVSAPRPDGVLRKIVVTYSAFFNGTRFPASDVAVYYDGVAQTLTVGADTLTGDPRSGRVAFIGDRAGGSVAIMNGVLAYIEVWPYAQSSTVVAANAALPCGIH